MTPRAHRPARPPVDPWTPHGTLRERERLPDGRVVDSVTIFLAGAQCPFGCVFCDLWRFTTLEPTPPGAIPAQIDRGLDEEGGPTPFQVKLYNASNFFERRAVPPEDDAAVAARLATVFQVVVESHPKLVGERCLDFGEALDGRLEVAMGLETVHPQALSRLDKGMTLADFDAAARRLRTAGHGVRAFVLVGVPFIEPAEQLAWTVRSVEHALDVGAEHVALIPVRGSTAAMQALRRAGEWAPPSLELVEAAFERCRSLGGGVVTVDLWDLDREAREATTRGRIERLRRLGLGDER